MKTRVGVLVSGSGSNLQALLDACRSPDYPAQLVVVISNVAQAFALERAQKAHVPVEVVDHKAYPDRQSFDEALVKSLRAHGVEWLCLAGFMRRVGAPLLEAFPGRILNIHPSLLPAFPGLHAVRQALLHGVKITGCTVHWVDEGLDSGPILVQSAVPVLPEDDESTLAARVLAEEHRAYPLALRLAVEGQVRFDGRRTHPPSDAGPTLGGLALRNPGQP